MRFAGILAALVTLAVACLPLEASNIAPDGIAISTHRTGGGDHGFGVGSSVFGNLVRHDIRAGHVEGSSVIYKGRARGACISFTGDSVAFIKLDSHLCVMSIDGSGLPVWIALKDNTLVQQVTKGGLRLVSQVELTVTDNTCSGSPLCGQGLSAVPAEPQVTVFGSSGFSVGEPQGSRATCDAVVHHRFSERRLS